MIELQDGNTVEKFSSATFASLVFSSAPVLLPYLFGGKAQALDYIARASTRPDGQYSAKRHRLAIADGKSIIACITLWDNELARSFHEHTLKSLKDFLSPDQIIHVLKTNDKLANAFVAPQEDQLCIGHLAVIEKYRCRGIGKKLLDYAIAQAKLKHKKQIVLDVDSKNAAALRFYTGAGFELDNSTEYESTHQIFYRMSYSL